MLRSEPSYKNRSSPNWQRAQEQIEQLWKAVRVRQIEINSSYIEPSKQEAHRRRKLRTFRTGKEQRIRLLVQLALSAFERQRRCESDRRRATIRRDLEIYLIATAYGIDALTMTKMLNWSHKRCAQRAFALGKASLERARALNFVAEGDLPRRGRRRVKRMRTLNLGGRPKKPPDPDQTNPDQTNPDQTSPSRRRRPNERVWGAWSPDAKWKWSRPDPPDDDSAAKNPNSLDERLARIAQAEHEQRQMHKARNQFSTNPIPNPMRKHFDTLSNRTLKPFTAKPFEQARPDPPKFGRRAFMKYRKHVKPKKPSKPPGPPANPAGEPSVDDAHKVSPKPQDPASVKSSPD